jgi:hypothetical protein
MTPTFRSTLGTLQTITNYKCTQATDAVSTGKDIRTNSQLIHTATPNSGPDIDSGDTIRNRAAAELRSDGLGLTGSFDKENTEPAGTPFMSALLDKCYIVLALLCTGAFFEDYKCNPVIW